jgi:hypothetical protein
MAKRDTRTQLESYPTESSDADLHRLLADKRRRVTLQMLSELTPLVDLDDLAALVAFQETEGLVFDDELEASVAITLHHVHLPMMHDLGIIEYDPEEARVKTCPTLPRPSMDIKPNEADKKPHP